jgi:hypothetical protein
VSTRPAVAQRLGPTARWRAAQRGGHRVRERRPTGDLLEVGRGHALYRIEIGEVRLAFGSTLVDIDVDDFRAVVPRPLQIR